jgi:hypothetical protein
MAAVTAKEFLEQWRLSYIYSEARFMEQLDEVVAECVDDAKPEGFSRQHLDKAAGGNLRDYIRKAIERMGGD